jgi:hypothetical protein
MDITYVYQCLLPVDIISVSGQYLCHLLLSICITYMARFLWVAKYEWRSGHPVHSRRAGAHERLHAIRRRVITLQQSSIRTRQPRPKDTNLTARSSQNILPSCSSLPLARYESLCQHLRHRMRYLSTQQDASTTSSWITPATSDPKWSLEIHFDRRHSQTPRIRQLRLHNGDRRSSYQDVSPPTFQGRRFTSEHLATMFTFIFRLHGIPQDIVSD